MGKTKINVKSTLIALTVLSAFVVSCNEDKKSAPVKPRPAISETPTAETQPTLPPEKPVETFPWELGYVSIETPTGERLPFKQLALSADDVSIWHSVNFTEAPIDKHQLQLETVTACTVDNLLKKTTTKTMALKHTHKMMEFFDPVDLFNPSVPKQAQTTCTIDFAVFDPSGHRHSEHFSRRNFSVLQGSNLKIMKDGKELIPDVDNFVDFEDWQTSDVVIHSPDVLPSGLIKRCLSGDSRAKVHSSRTSLYHAFETFAIGTEPEPGSPDVCRIFAQRQDGVVIGASPIMRIHPGSDEMSLESAVVTDPLKDLTRITISEHSFLNLEPYNVEVVIPKSATLNMNFQVVTRKLIKKGKWKYYGYMTTAETALKVAGAQGRETEAGLRFTLSPGQKAIVKLASTMKSVKCKQEIIGMNIDNIAAEEMTFWTRKADATEDFGHITQSFGTRFKQWRPLLPPTPDASVIEAAPTLTTEHTPKLCSVKL